MAKRVAAALAIELQSYGIVAAVQPAAAPIQVNGTMSTRDAISASKSRSTGASPARRRRRSRDSKTRAATAEDYAEASERLVSRSPSRPLAVATLIGRRRPSRHVAGQVAAG